MSSTTKGPEVSGLYKQLLDGMLDPSILVDQHKRVLAFNNAYAASVGMDSSQLSAEIEKGMKCFELLPLDICEKLCAANSCQEKTSSIRRENVEGKADGKKYIVAAIPLEHGWVLESYRHVSTANQNTSQLEELLKKESSEKKRLEKELRQAHDQMVLQEKLSALGRLVAGIAHELNNPINFVYGNIDFAQKYIEDLVALVKSIDEDPELPETTRKRLDGYKKAIDFEYLKEDSVRVVASLRSGAERSAEIVRDLKSFSRTDGRDFQKIDVLKQIESTLNLINPLVKKRVQVKRVYDKNLPLIVGNSGHLNQVLMNILTNAAQAIEGEGEIIIQVGRWRDNGLSIVIADSGPGIEDAVMEKILDPFFTTKESGEGTGLGLWITQNIIRNHGGKILVSNRPEGGACFEIRLPENPPNVTHMKK